MKDILSEFKDKRFDKKSFRLDILDVSFVFTSIVLLLSRSKVDSMEDISWSCVIETDVTLSYSTTGKAKSRSKNVCRTHMCPKYGPACVS